MNFANEPVRSIPKPTHKRRVPKRKDRGKFPKKVREEIKKYFNNQCQECGGKGIHIHHVEPKGSGDGRGVFTNGLLVCNDCHRYIHDHDERLRYWKEVFKKKYGRNFYKDRMDLIQEYRKEDLREMDNEVERWMKYNG